MSRRRKDAPAGGDGPDATAREPVPADPAGTAGQGAAAGEPVPADPDGTEVAAEIAADDDVVEITAEPVAAPGTVPADAAPASAPEPPPAPAPEPPPGPPPSVEELLEQLGKVTAERDEYLDVAQRERASLQNAQRKSKERQAEAVATAVGRALEPLLPVLDVCDAAAAGPHNDPDPDTVAQISDLLFDALRRSGLERITALDTPFDPKFHDCQGALPAEPADPAEAEPAEPPAPRVVEELRAGYQLNGRVLRPTSVLVDTLP
ncbi:MAG TPA: nucleotide exchange factor GrpE [Acidimicrobiaceae bacterium]|nr:nucleotide exchange factor GrpE [Acidimicrobiaceae bacterium]